MSWDAHCAWLQYNDRYFAEVHNDSDEFAAYIVFFVGVAVLFFQTGELAEADCDTATKKLIAAFLPLPLDNSVQLV